LLDDANNYCSDGVWINTPSATRQLKRYALPSGGFDSDRKNRTGTAKNATNNFLPSVNHQKTGTAGRFQIHFHSGFV
jgi:hypothetical protein